MYGVARKSVDSAGGAQLNGGQGFVTIDGARVVLLGDPVQGHGEGGHAGPVMAEGSSFVRINGGAGLPGRPPGQLWSRHHRQRLREVERLMDLAITYNDRELTFAPAVQNVDLATESGLRSAVLVSLFTDRRAAEDDPLPSSALGLRGWWADAWPEMEGDLVGSRLWLIEDNVATAVAVSAEWMRTGVLRLQVAITLADQTRFKDVFNYQLQAA